MAARGFDRIRQIRGCRFVNRVVKPRAATEGRPYSAFRVVTRLSANNTDRGFVTRGAAEGDADEVVALDVD